MIVVTIFYQTCGYVTILGLLATLQWRHNGRDGVSNHQPHHCLLNRIFRRRSKKTSELRVTGLYARNSPVTGEFPAQMASNAENGSIWWRHHEERRDALINVNQLCPTDKPNFIYQYESYYKTISNNGIWNTLCFYIIELSIILKALYYLYVAFYSARSCAISSSKLRKLEVGNVVY